MDVPLRASRQRKTLHAPIPGTARDLGHRSRSQDQRIFPYELFDRKRTPHWATAELGTSSDEPRRRCNRRHHRAPAVARESPNDAPCGGANRGPQSCRNAIRQRTTGGAGAASGAPECRSNRTRSGSSLSPHVSPVCLFIILRRSIAASVRTITVHRAVVEITWNRLTVSYAIMSP